MFSGPTQPDATLQRFIKAFVERYEDNEVPLTEALDVDNGIGYGNHQGRTNDFGGFIDQLPLNKAVSETISANWYNPLHSLLANRILDAYASKSSVITLTDDELKTLPGGDLANWNHNTYSCGFSLFEDEQKQPIIQLNGCGGHTAAALVGRFCHADPALDSLVRSITQYEETINADCLLAEINHLPQDRLGNVMQRPVLRTYEIPVLTNSVVDPAHQLPLSDLLVSVRQERVILRSRKYNRRVLPYLTSALNHEQFGVPVFKFLGDLQLQENALGLGINMGVLPHIFSYVPRLQYKNIILKRATWFLNVQQIKALTLAAQKSHTAFNAEADALGLPAYFVVADYDNEMPICRANTDSVSLFADMVKGKNKLVLLEFLPAQYTTPVRSETGDWYTNECVLFFKNSSKVARPVVHHLAGETSQTAHKLPIQSSFVPGSEWVYVKLYSGLKVADQLIANLNTMLQPLQAGHIIRNWFFIRYSEGGNHIRLRLQMAQPDQISNVFAHLTPLFDQWKQQRLIWKVSLDTYEREWQRYGAATMEISERLFGLDSQLVSTLVRRLPDQHRWLAGLCLADLWMNAFGLTTAEKLAFTNRMKEAFEKEFNASSDTRKFLNATSGKYKQLITSLLSGQSNPDEQGVELFIRQTLNIHHGQMLELMNQLRECRPGEPLVIDLLSSFVHMSMNRLFRSRQRLFEYAIYHFLRVHYTTQHHAAERIAKTATPVSSILD
jgi:lantibiotic biosynthesis protein